MLALGFAAVFFLVAVVVAFLVVLLLAAGFFSVFLSALSLFLVVVAFLGAALEAAALGAAAFCFGSVWVQDQRAWQLTLGAGFAAGSFLASFNGPEGPGGKRRVS